MIASADYRHWYPGSGPKITLTMTADEFREHVEFLETVAPHDGCTRDWRKQLDRLVLADGAGEGERDAAH